MFGGRQGAAARQLVRVYSEGPVSGLTEGQLLERFLRRRDEAAFEALVARHGPMVLGVCGRLLRDPADVEDAFQATFLVLVRRAAGLRDGERLGPWLFGVATRVAKRLRSRRRLAGEFDFEPPAPGEGDPDLDEIRRVLDEELTRLPEKYRSPLVLCYLEGLTHDQAAERLKWPVGTVRGRMARGRDLLRGRLVRRGLAPTAAVLTTALSADARSVVPPPLAASTVRLEAALGAGRTLLAGAVPASVLGLADGITGGLLMHPVKLAAGVLVAGLVVGGAVASARQEGSAAGVVSAGEPKGAPGSSSATAVAKEEPQPIRAAEKTVDVRPSSKVEAGGTPPDLALPPIADTPKTAELLELPSAEPDLSEFDRDTRQRLTAMKNSIQADIGKTKELITAQQASLKALNDRLLRNMELLKRYEAALNLINAASPPKATGVFDSPNPHVDSPVALDAAVPTLSPSSGLTPVDLPAPTSETPGLAPALPTPARQPIQPTPTTFGAPLPSPDAQPVPAANDLIRAPRAAPDAGTLPAGRESLPDFPMEGGGTRKLGTAVEDGPHKVQVEEVLRIGVLEALPGRPLNGLSKVRRDGTIGLDWYGNLRVVGLTRDEIKVKLIEHLKKHLTDEVLGLVTYDEDKELKMPPIESDCVFVEDEVVLTEDVRRDPPSTSPAPVPPRQSRTGRRSSGGSRESLPNDEDDR